MNPKFKQMVDEPQEVHITLDREDPNASKCGIVMDSNRNNKSLMRKSDMSDGLIDTNYKSANQLDTDPHDSPHSFSKQLDFDHLVTGKSDKGIVEDSPKSGVQMQQTDTAGNLPMVNYFVPLLLSPSAIFDIFEQT